MNPGPRPLGIPAMLAACLAGGGCATVDPTADFARAASAITRATGTADIYRPDDDAVVEAKVSELLTSGLTSGEAVQIALLNNPELQASFYGIGMAKADLVQSGLLTNPMLGVSTRFPTGSGLAAVEAGIAQNIADLWQIPARREAAKGNLARAVLSVAHQAAELAADVKAAYHRAVASRNLLVIAGEDREAAEQLLRLTETLRDSGAVSGVDVDLSRSELLSVELLVRSAERDALARRSDLVRLLGLPLSRFDIALVDDLPAAPPPPITLDHLLEIASERRLDLAAARAELLALTAAHDLEQRRLFRVVELGAEYEREARDGDAALGPALGIELPLFDQNQAQIAKAGFARAQAVKRLRSMVLDVAHDVRLAHDQARAIWDAARFYESEFLPLKESSLNLAREAYRAGKLPLVAVLEAQRALREAHAGRIEILRDAALARLSLEQATACPEGDLAGDAASDINGSGNDN